MTTKLNVAYIKTTSANTYDLLRINATGNLSYASVNDLNLTTANVNELGSNLYYSNARVYSNVASMLSTYTGNINAGNVVANSIVASSTGSGTISSSADITLSATGNINLSAANIRVANLIVDRITANSWSGLIAGNNIIIAANGQISANLLAASVNVNSVTGNLAVSGNIIANGSVYANSIVASANGSGSISSSGDISLVATGNINLTASNVRVANIIVDRITANSWTGLTTANVTESTNLYYTNARVYSNVAPLLTAKANVTDLTTANVLEVGSSIYYTNARVYSNVASILAGNVNMGNITTGTITANTIVGGGGGGYITGANLISSNIISATTWTGLYAANVVGLNTANVSELNNLYYTNARVYSNILALLPTLAGNNIIIAANGQISANLLAAGGGAASSVQSNGVIGLNTANVNEFGSNLYYTNTRVFSNVTALLSGYAGNVNVGNIVTGTISANTIVGGGGGGYITGANLISTNIISAATWTGLYASNIVGLTTANVTELTNLYYTNARVYSNVFPLLAAKANVTDLTTANITELTNLYYTNARVYSNVTSMLATYTGNIQAGNLAIQGGSGGTIGGANLISTNTISAINWLGIYTANVLESASNLYYTNARVYSNVIALLPTLAGNNIIIAANGQISANLLAAGGGAASSVQANGVIGLNTANVNEFGSNLYYTNTRVYSNVASMLATYTGNIQAGNLAIQGGSGGTIGGANLISTNTISAINWLGLYAANIVGLTTANVSEVTNLYYTNARTRSALSGGTGVSYDPTAGTIAIGQNVSPNVTVTFANLIVTGTTSFYGNVTTYSSNNLSISDNMIYLNNGSQTSNPDMGFAGNYNDGSYHHAGFFRDASDSGTWKVFENYSPEPDANIFIDTTHATFRLANLAATTFIGNVTGTVSSISNFSTSNLSEGTNLYYTNARVYANVIGLLSAKANVSDLTTANVTEVGSSIYYTNARVYSNVATMLPTYTGNVNAGNVIANTIISGSATTGAISATTDINLTAGGNISFNAANVYTSNIVANRVTANSFIATGAGSGTISSSADFGITATGNINLSASNVRVTNLIVDKITANIWSGLIAGNNIIIAANGQISANLLAAGGGAASSVQANGVIGLNTANVNEFGSNLYYTNARVYSNVVAILPTYTGNINAGNVIANTIISASATTGAISATADINFTAGGNISLAANNLYTGNIIANKVTANTFIATGAGSGTISSSADFGITATGNINLSAANVYTSNIVANRVTANSWGQLYAGNVIGLNTANVPELGGSIYYSNARVYSNVIGLLSSYATVANLNLKANIADLTTANVVEVGNSIYYTNARVYSNVIALLPTYTGNIGAGNLAISGGAGGSLVGANLISANNLSAVNWLGLYAANVVGLTTANVSEVNNLYYTNARVYSNILALLPTLAGNNIIIAANGQISANLLAAGGGTASSVQANGVIGLNTANVNEFGSNLYYTNARVYSNIIALLPTYTGNIGAGNLAISGGAGGSLVGANLISANNLSAVNWLGLYAANVVGLTTANVAELTNLYYTNTRVYSNVSPLLAAKANVTDLTTSNVTEVGSSIYYTNARVYSNVLALLPTYGGNIGAGNLAISGGFGGSVTGANLISANNLSAVNWLGLYAANVVGLTTANVIEIGSNLYFTNTRARATISAGTGILYDNTTGIISISQNVSPNATVTFANLIVTGTTTFYGNVSTYTSNNLSISDNMIYLNSGSATANPDMGIAGNYNDGVYHHAGIFRDASDAGTWKVFENYSPEPDASVFIDTTHATFRLANLAATTFIGNVSGTAGSISNFSTSNLVEGSNLYYTNTRVYANVIALLQTLAGNNIIIAANGQISANLLAAGGGTASSVLATSVVGLNTANVSESASNLYYTNTRVSAALQSFAGDNITVESNGRISANFYSNTQLIAGSSAFTNYNLSYTGATNSSIIVAIEGLVQIPGVDYYVSGQTLTLTSSPSDNSNIEVRFMGLKQSQGPQTPSTSMDTISAFLLMGA